MSIESLAKDKVDLIKKDGKRVATGIKASVQSGMIFTFDGKLPIEDGDRFERKRAAGIVEAWEVLDAGFQAGIGGIPAHFQSKVQKITGTKPPDSKSTQVINIHQAGPQSRVNVKSQDQSTNVIQTLPDGFRVRTG